MKPRRQVVIKGSSLPVLRIVVRDGDAQSLRTDIADTIDDGRAMLAEAIAVLDLRERETSDADPIEIVEAVRARVRLAAVLIADPGARVGLGNLDLPIIEAPLTARDRPGRGTSEAQALADAPPESEPSVAQAPQRPAPASVGEATEPATSSRPAPLLLTRPLRSGQRMYAQGRDAVVVAPTSRGSELIADGSVYAFSPIRGRVLAGASGDTSACIVATHLDAELVAVAGVYRTLEPDDLKEHGSGPVRVSLSLDADGNERLTLAGLGLSPSMQFR